MIATPAQTEATQDRPGRSAKSARSLFAREGLFAALLPLAAIVVCAAVAGGCTGLGPTIEDQGSAKEASVEESPPTAADRKTEAIINSLAALESESGVGFDAPEHVQKAKEQLAQLGIHAFPALIRHIDDKRFCYATEPLGNGPPWGVERVSVGFVCRQIVAFQVDLVGCRYKLRQGTDGKWHGRPDYFWEHEMKQWWLKRKGKRLGELRAEIVKWSVQQERATGFATPADEVEYLHPLLELEGEVKKLGDSPRTWLPPCAI